MCENFKNQLLSLNDIIQIFKVANLKETPQKLEIYQRAFVHNSFLKNTNYKSYEILEFYGDSVISVVTVQYLFERYGEVLDEGKLSKIKNKIVSTKYLSSFAKYFGLDQFILLSSYLENLEARTNNKIIEDVFEALIAAIAVDLGFSAAKTFFMFCLENLVNYAHILHVNDNYKDRVLNYFQLHGWSHPQYEIDTELGFYHHKTFVVSLLKNADGQSVVICTGVGKTKKQAEMDASFNALKKFNMLKKTNLYI